MRYGQHFLQALLLGALATSSLALPARVAARGGHQTGTPYIVVLDAGHGGSDTGAAASDTEVEKYLTLAVAKVAAKDLQAMGYRVYVDRRRDQAVNTPPRDLNADGQIDHVDEFSARTLFANRHHADLLVSIHFDASTNEGIHGTHGYYCPARPFWRQSEKLAKLLTSSVSSAVRQAGYGDTNNGVETDVADVVPQTRADYPWFLVLGPSVRHYVIGSAMPGALVETMYLSSPRDAAALLKQSIIKAAARGYANGIRMYFAGQSRR